MEAAEFKQMLAEIRRLESEKAELLAALNGVSAGSFYGDSTGYYHCDRIAMINARAAIAKAEGSAE